MALRPAEPTMEADQLLEGGAVDSALLLGGAQSLGESPDPLHQFKELGALLTDQSFAQEVAEQSDVGAQRRVWLGGIVGGLVKDGTVQRQEGSLEMTFQVTDLRCDLGVSYSGVLPDLFREGQGVVAHGRMDEDGTFVADEILAKHDENYMAPEVADSLVDHVQDQTLGLQDGPEECPTGDS